MPNDTSAISTATSASEGRLKVGVGGKAAKKSKLHSLIKKYKKDGKGGPGMMPPIMPDPMDPRAANPQMPPTGMSPMSMPGMPPSMPAGMPGMVPPGVGPTAETPAMRPPKTTNKPHKSTRGSVTNRPKTAKGLKKMGILKDAVAGRPKITNAYHPRNVGRKPSF
jgi:hypothetical protein